MTHLDIQFLFYDLVSVCFFHITFWYMGISILSSSSMNGYVVLSIKSQTHTVAP